MNSNSSFEIAYLNFVISKINKIKIQDQMYSIKFYFL